MNPALFRKKDILSGGEMSHLFSAAEGSLTGGENDKLGFKKANECLYWKAGFFYSLVGGDEYVEECKMDWDTPGRNPG